MNQQEITAQTNPARGRLTGAALDDTACLFLPYAADPFGFQRRPLSLQGMKLSLELARMAYTLELAPWIFGGWTDVSIQVDNQLTTGLKGMENDGFTDRVHAAVGSLRVARARRAIREHNPLSQVTGALRQRTESDTTKAVVMIHPAAEDRWVVAIGFMGTGARFYDWFSNLRLSTENGFHQGFFQLTQAFLKNAAEIRFPETATALGLKELTLQEILTEMQSPDSRFSLWMAGHSQGAAVMQVYCDVLLRDRGVLPQHVIGCGFASPTVATDDTVAGCAAYPLYHVVNDDDMIPRMGSLKQFGLCLLFTPDAKFRDSAYGWSRDEADRQARRDVERLTLHITDTPSFLVAFTALLEVVCQEKTDDSIFGVSQRLLAIAPLDRAFSFVGKKAKSTLQTMIAYMHKSYLEIRGAAMDETAVSFLMESFRPIVRATQLKALLEAMYERLYPPHSLYNSTENGAYWRIVTQRSKELKPFIWQDDPLSPPYRRYAREFYSFQNAPSAAPRARQAARARTRVFARRRALHVPR